MFNYQGAVFGGDNLIFLDPPIPGGPGEEGVLTKVLWAPALSGPGVPRVILLGHNR